MTMQWIASSTATGSNDLAFTNIPQTFTHLQVRVFLRSGQSAVQDFNYLRINGDFNSNYVSHGLVGDGSSSASFYYNPRSYNWLADIPGNTATANIFGASVIDILDYTSFVCSSANSYPVAGSRADLYGITTSELTGA